MYEVPNWVTTIAYMGACRKRIGGFRAILVCTEKRRVCERSTLVQVVGAGQPNPPLTRFSYVKFFNRLVLYKDGT
jgi:hypothetical protein